MSGKSVYYKVKDSNQVIKISVDYELGGYNYFSGKVNKRGYYLYAQPVEVTDRGGYISESTTLFSGFKQIIKEVDRKSKKSEAEAVAYYNDNALAFAQKMADQNGWTIDGELKRKE